MRRTLGTNGKIDRSKGNDQSNIAEDSSRISFYIIYLPYQTLNKYIHMTTDIERLKNIKHTPSLLWNVF